MQSRYIYYPDSTNCLGIQSPPCDIYLLLAQMHRDFQALKCFAMCFSFKLLNLQLVEMLTHTYIAASPTSKTFLEHVTEAA